MAAAFPAPEASSIATPSPEKRRRLFVAQEQRRQCWQPRQRPADAVRWPIVRPSSGAPILYWQEVREICAVDWRPSKPFRDERDGRVADVHRGGMVSAAIVLRVDGVFNHGCPPCFVA